LTIRDDIPFFQLTFFDYKECYSFIQHTFLTTGDGISAFSLPFWLQGMIFLLSAYLWLQGMIFLLAAYLYDYKGWYSFFQLTFLTTRDDISYSSLPFWLQGMIFLISTYPFDNKGWYSFFQLSFFNAMRYISALI
jgi:hypothetical protein